MRPKIGKCLLQELLKTAGMSQQGLANKAKMTKSQISDYAHNRKNMSLENAKVIADILECKIDDLYDWIYS